MFESNFPVDKVSYSYNVLYNAFKRLSQGYSPAERAALFHDTAARVYRLRPSDRARQRHWRSPPHAHRTEYNSRALLSGVHQGDGADR